MNGVSVPTRPCRSFSPHEPERGYPQGKLDNTPLKEYVKHLAVRGGDQDHVRRNSGAGEDQPASLQYVAGAVAKNWLLTNHGNGRLPSIVAEGDRSGNSPPRSLGAALGTDLSVPG